MPAAIPAAFVATLVFTLGPAAARAARPFPGLAMGLPLVPLLFPFTTVTGLSVNPARSLAPAVFVGGKALAQVWLFLVVPTIAGAVSGWLYRANVLEG